MGRIGSCTMNYSTRASDYKLLEEVGYGASATVYRAIYLPLNDVVAVKCLDLDRCNANLDDIRREAQTMSLIDHPCVVKAHCSFVVERYLWVVMPFMAEGSCLHLMKIAYPDGFEEPAICSILKESLKALEYLHRHGHIHRDVKAGNILLDSSGAVKLADFGVSAFVFDGGDRRRSRNTFVGTPCWMAPEVLQPGSGYDFKADIWSFGITALELAHGHAPFSKYPPMKVLLMTIQNAPPGLDYDRDKKFSKSFKEMVAMCLVKDQTKRPTSEKLLKHSFFKGARPPELSLKKIFTDLPPLWNRVKALQLKDAAQLALKRMPSAEAEAISQSEYNRGVSAWNFDINDLKAQASLVHDDDELHELEEDDSIKSLYNDKGYSYAKSQHFKSSFNRGQTSDCLSLRAEGSHNNSKTIHHDYMELCGSEDKKSDPGRDCVGVSSSTSSTSPPDKDLKTSKTRSQSLMHSKSQSGPLHPFAVISHTLTEKGRAFDRCDRDSHSSLDNANRELRKVPCLSGPLMLPTRASSNSLSAPIKSTGGYTEYLDDKSKSSLIQIKGRFSVTSESVENLKRSSPLRKSASVGEWMIQPKQMPISVASKEIGSSSSQASFLAPYLCSFIQQSSFQQDLMTNLLNSIQVGDVEACQDGKSPLSPVCHSENDSIEEACFERERSLLKQISELQKRMISLTEELIVERLKYINLQQRLNTTPVSVTSREEEEKREEEESKGKGWTVK